MSTSHYEFVGQYITGRPDTMVTRGLAPDLNERHGKLHGMLDKCLNGETVITVVSYCCPGETHRRYAFIAIDVGSYAGSDGYKRRFEEVGVETGYKMVFTNNSHLGGSILLITETPIDPIQVEALLINNCQVLPQLYKESIATFATVTGESISINATDFCEWQTFRYFHKTDADHDKIDVVLKGAPDVMSYTLHRSHMNVPFLATWLRLNFMRYKRRMNEKNGIY